MGSCDSKCGTTRRAFLTDLGRWAAGAAALPLALQALLESAAHADAVAAEGRYYEALDGRRARCHVCPLHCTLEDGETCFCRTRTNVGGQIVNRAYANPCLLNIDPVERTPANHFLPGTRALALGLGGCNLRCLYCQNWQQSQQRPEDLANLDLPVEEAFRRANDNTCRTICYTYTEPVAFYGYVLDIAQHARSRGVRNLVATAAYIEEAPLIRLCREVDAFTVTLKGFTDEFYNRVCGVHLRPVLDALRVIRREGVWLEITNLVIPTYNDDTDGIRRMCDWIAENLGPDVPLHFSQFFPDYRLRDLPRTPRPVLEEAAAIAQRAGLRYVYLSNVSPHDLNHTRCHGCGEVLIRRLGFRVLENHMDGSRCPSCRTEIPGVWA